MMYAIALGLASAIGYLSIRLLAGHAITGFLRIFLGMALGLGIVSQIAFYTHIWFNWHSPWIVAALSLIGLGILLALNSKMKDIDDTIAWPKQWPLLVLLGIIIVFTLMEALYYPLGGWDAWSCWNLKAKFIYLGQERWKDMLEPQLWRSNTHYPLFLPCLNVWFWDFCGQAHAWVPMLNSVLLTSLTAAILMFGLQVLTGMSLMPAILTAFIFLNPFNITLGASQYSDIAFALFLLSAFVLKEKIGTHTNFSSNTSKISVRPYFLIALFIGFLSFTKVEGTVAAGLFTAIMLWEKRVSFVPVVLLGSLPTILFNVFLSPKNEAFINGLLSNVKPSTFERLNAIASYVPGELLSLKWNGIWVLIVIGLIIAGKKAWDQQGRAIGMFICSYMAIVMAYYFVNTFFEIQWWLNNTLNRILFSLLPLLMLWVGIGNKKPATGRTQ